MAKSNIASMDDKGQEDTDFYEIFFNALEIMTDEQKNEFEGFLKTLLDKHLSQLQEDSLVQKWGGRIMIPEYHIKTKNFSHELPEII